MRAAEAALALTVCLSASCGMGGGGQPGKEKEAPPAKVSNRVIEADLTRIELTEKAAQRLGITLVAAAVREVPDEQLLAGDLMLPPGKAIFAIAPIGGRLEAEPGLRVAVGRQVRAGEIVLRLIPFLPVERDLRVTFEADLLGAEARVAAAKANLERARQLLQDRAGSQRNLEQAEQEDRQAAALLGAAKARLQRLETRPLEADLQVAVPAPVSGMIRIVNAEPGQVVGGGANLFEVADFSTLWLRVPIYAGESKLIARLQSVMFDDMSGRGAARHTARRIPAPPTGDPLAVTVDQYFSVTNADGQWRPGQRVGVHVPTAAAAKGLAVPESSIVYDVHGGAWVYVEEKPLVYRRVAVVPVRAHGGFTVLAKGPAVGARVVTAGVAELFGTEFGAGK